MSDEAWEIGARVGRYRIVPANEHERRQMEAIGHAEFDAVSIGRQGEGPQIAIVPLDESSREIAEQIVKLHNDYITAGSDAGWQRLGKVGLWGIRWWVVRLAALGVGAGLVIGLIIRGAS